MKAPLEEGCCGWVGPQTPLGPTRLSCLFDLPNSVTGVAVVNVAAVVIAVNVVDVVNVVAVVAVTVGADVWIDVVIHVQIETTNESISDTLRD